MGEGATAGKPTSSTCKSNKSGVKNYILKDETKQSLPIRAMRPIRPRASRMNHRMPPVAVTAQHLQSLRPVRTWLNALPRALAGPGVAEKHADAQEGVAATTAAWDKGPAPVGPQCTASVTTAGSVLGQSGHPSTSPAAASRPPSSPTMMSSRKA